jgi:glycosyltransferase involved in cell wall biosynthesis
MKPFVPDLVSAIIPVYNGKAYVAAAIESALAQSYPKLEIIVTNDGSTDGTDEVLARYRESIVIVEQPNGGVARARNRAIHIACLAP